MRVRASEALKAMSKMEDCFAAGLDVTDHDPARTSEGVFVEGATAHADAGGETAATHGRSPAAPLRGLPEEESEQVFVDVSLRGELSPLEAPPRRRVLQQVAYGRL